MSNLILTRPQRLAIEHPAIEAEQTTNPILKTVDFSSRWSRILSLNCGFE